ncbi:MAG: NTP transferase domain-containing protein [Chlorobi bacterium]|nr:NTP transferase domain-containing protein [Chlorobiota bacterium]
MKHTSSAVILAAGHSSRMGKNKFAIELANGMTFLENIIIAYDKMECNSIVVVANSDGAAFFNSFLKNKYRGLQLAENHDVDRGRSYSIRLGLEKLKNCQSVFVHNVDNPYADPEILKMMIERIKDYDFVRILNKGRGGHPVLLSAKIIEEILSLKVEDINLKNILTSNKGVGLEVSNSNILININTVDDYEKFTFAQSGTG